MVETFVGPYRVVRLLGEGGIGAVYEAVNESIERRVAIKILRADHADRADVVTRFFNEARAVNRIAHPSIVQIYEQGRLPDGTAYIVMEFLEGQTLTQRLKQAGGRLPPRYAIQLAWQVAAALSAAHAKGIAHRDLKPDNLMLVPDPLGPGGERVKVLDFGIAKLAADTLGKESAQAIMGTPTYMSPEQCHGADEADEKTDVYALGVMVFEMLAGRPPFVAEVASDLVGMHLFREPPPLTEFVPNVPPEIASLTSSLLVKDKAQRPAMDAVSEQLADLVSAEGGIFSPMGARQSASNSQALAPVTGGGPAGYSATGASSMLSPRPAGLAPAGPHGTGAQPIAPMAMMTSGPSGLMPAAAMPVPADSRQSAAMAAVAAQAALESPQAPPHDPALAAAQAPPPPLKSLPRLLFAGLGGSAAVLALILAIRLWMGHSPSGRPPTGPGAGNATGGDVVAAGQPGLPTMDPAVAGTPGAGSGTTSPGTATERPWAIQYPRPAGLKLPPYRLANVAPIEPHPTPASPNVATPAKPGLDVDKVLGDAQAAYLMHQYPQAIELARSVQQAGAARAWRIIGSSACMQKNVQLARDAYQKLDVPGRLYVVVICGRTGITEATLNAGPKP